MRAILHPKLIAGRIRRGMLASDDSWGLTGGFFVKGPCNAMLKIIASDSTGDKDDVAKGWEHVSVSTANRCPNWEEMCFVKDLFWTDEETVVQFHPPKSEYISNHPYVLHLFRDSRNGHTLPPSILVGIKSYGDVSNDPEARARMYREFEESVRT